MEFYEQRYGSFLHHALHLGKYGSVFWHVNTPSKSETTSKFEYTEITKAYFYVTSVKKVQYVCDIGFIGSTEQMDEPSKLVQYVPEWRKKDWKDSLKSPWGYWILITDIKELIQPREFSDFNRFDTKEPLKAPPQAYFFIEDRPEYESV